jgi:ribokinase
MIHVIGNASIDTVIRLARFPMPGETLVAEQGAEDLGGKGANQAIAMARCGTPVRLVAAIGRDESGKRIRANLEAEGVATDGLEEWDGATDRCIIYVDAKGENTIVSLIEAAIAFDPLAQGADSWIRPKDHVVLQGNLRPHVTRDCLVAARRRQAITVLNPSPAYPPGEYDWSLVDIAIVNRLEAQQLGGSDDPQRAARNLIESGAGAVVMTEGAGGATWFNGKRALHAPAPPVTSVDTVGAGDVFCGAFVAGLATGRHADTALLAATEAASLAVTRRGVLAAFPSRLEFQAIWTRAEKSDAALKPIAFREVSS